MTDFAAVERRASRIKLLLMDCDGVFTDGKLFLLEAGEEQKSFHVRDGHGLVLFHRAGLKSAILSGRKSTAVDRRALELGISFVRQGSLDKIKDFEALLHDAEVEEYEVATIGDDVTDIQLMRRSELAIAVADAVEETQAAAHYVTKATGGNGAVREAVELILKAQGRWNELMQSYTD